MRIKWNSVSIDVTKLFLLPVVAARVSWWDAWAAQTSGGFYPNEKHLAASYFLPAICSDLAQQNNNVSFVAGWLLSRRWSQIAHTAGGSDVISRPGRKKGPGETEMGQRVRPWPRKWEKQLPKWALRCQLILSSVSRFTKGFSPPSRNIVICRTGQ